MKRFPPKSINWGKNEVTRIEEELRQIHTLLSAMSGEVSNVRHILKGFLPRGDGRPDHVSPCLINHAP